MVNTFGAWLSRNCADNEVLDIFKCWLSRNCLVNVRLVFLGLGRRGIVWIMCARYFCGLVIVELCR